MASSIFASQSQPYRRRIARQLDQGAGRHRGRAPARRRTSRNRSISKSTAGTWSFDRSKALHLSRYLHDLGVFLHFQDDPLLARTVILQEPVGHRSRVPDPRRRNREGAARPIQPRRLRAPLARFRVRRYAPRVVGADAALRALLRAEGQQPAEPGSPRNYLPPAKPIELADWGKPEDLVLRYRYEFLPKGIISRLTGQAASLRAQPGVAWVTGVLFERDSTAVLVELLASGSEIELRARGPERKRCSAWSAADLDALNESIPRPARQG